MAISKLFFYIVGSGARLTAKKECLIWTPDNEDLPNSKKVRYGPGDLKSTHSNYRHVHVDKLHIKVNYR